MYRHVYTCLYIQSAGARKGFGPSSVVQSVSCCQERVWSIICCTFSQLVPGKGLIHHLLYSQSAVARKGFGPSSVVHSVSWCQERVWSIICCTFSQLVPGKGLVHHLFIGIMCHWVIFLLQHRHRQIFLIRLYIYIY